MAHPTYNPYYLPNHRQRRPPEYYYHPISAVENTAHNYLYTNPPQIPMNNNNNNIKIPKEKRHINTLFVSGLPDDVIPREIHNLFCRRPGFDSSQLKFTGHRNQVVAFVTFLNHESAVLALEALDGTQFDPQDGSILHIELARSNSRKRKPGSGPYTVIDKRRKAVDDAEEMSSEDGDNTAGQNGDLDISSNDKDSTETSDVKMADLSDPKAAKNIGKPTEKPSSGDLQPCSTLFIANLGTKYSDDELRETFSKYPGFTGLKLRANRGLPTAFADYEEVEQATNAMEALKDTTLPSSDIGSIVIEYARSKMRKP